jgi:transposase
MSEPILAPTEVPPSPRSRDAVRQTWAERLARFASAGLTTAQFCAAEGVSVASFYLWKRRLAAQGFSAGPELSRPEAGPRFLPVRLADKTPAIELVLPGGAVLRLGPGADEASLGSLLRLLGVLPC